MMRLVVALLAGSIAYGDDVGDAAARIETLAFKEPLLPRSDTLRQAAKLLAPERPELADQFRGLAACISVENAPARFSLPKLTADNELLLRLVEEVEHSGDDPAAYTALAAIIRANQLSAGLDNPSIRARIALADLDELLDPILTTLDTREVRLSRYRSKTVLLAFWATWCVPCRAELSKLEKMSQASSDITVLAITWEPRDVVAKFLREHPYRLPMFIDSGHKLGDRFRVDTLPATIELEPARVGKPVLR